jgi:hypothetical protein
VDLHKNYKSAVEGQVQAFFNFVQMGYKNIEETVSKVFAESVSVFCSNNRFQILLDLLAGQICRKS